MACSSCLQNEFAVSQTINAEKIVRQNKKGDEMSPLCLLVQSCYFCTLVRRTSVLLGVSGLAVSSAVTKISKL